MNDTRAWRYVPWIARDYLLWGGIATFVLLVAFGAFLSEGLILIANAQSAGPLSWSLNPAELRGVATKLMVALATIGPVIATLGIASKDRQLGYYRFLFSRPISAPTYYVVTFGVNGIGFMLVAAALWGAFALFFQPMPAAAYLAMMALSYLFLGGLIFLISVLVRYDLVILVLIYATASATWDVLDGGPPVSWVLKARPVLSLLPPVKQHLELIFAILRADVPLSWLTGAWVFAYGTMCVVAATLLLKRRALGGAP
jgi:hypothetical protein